VPLERRSWSWVRELLGEERSAELIEAAHAELDILHAQTRAAYYQENSSQGSAGATHFPDRRNSRL
jgi:hypothetical protein